MRERAEQNHVWTQQEPRKLLRELNREPQTLDMLDSLPPLLSRGKEHHGQVLSTHHVP